jgi:hypothetical protein
MNNPDWLANFIGNNVYHLLTGLGLIATQTLLTYFAARLAVRHGLRRFRQ